MTQDAAGTGKPPRTRRTPAAVANADEAPKKTAAPRTRKAPVKAAEPAVEPEATAKAPATKPAARTRKTPAAKTAAKEEPTLEQVAAGEVEVQFERDGDDVVLTVGGKKRSLDEVDDSQFSEAEEAPLEKELRRRGGGELSLSDSDAYRQSPSSRSSPPVRPQTRSRTTSSRSARWPCSMPPKRSSWPSGSRPACSPRSG